MQINFPARSQAGNQLERRRVSEKKKEDQNRNNASRTAEKQPIKISQKYINNNWPEEATTAGARGKKTFHMRVESNRGVAGGGAGGLARLEHSKHLAILANELFMRPGQKGAAPAQKPGQS